MPSARSAKLVAAPAAPVTVKRPFVPSAMQRDVFDEFRDGHRHLVVGALAGAGKTTTILHAIEYAPEPRVLVLAFMRRIKEEMEAKLLAMDSRAEVRTAHALGYQAIRDAKGYIRVCERFEREDDLAQQVCGGMPYGAKRLVAKLVTKARELQPTGATVATLIDLALDYDLAPPPGDALSLESIARATLQAMRIAADVWPRHTGIDHADQIYLPLANDWLQPSYDMVVVDEAQDLTLPQLEMARRACVEGGRIVIVGDRNQAIFGFRGADSGSLDRLKKELHAHELPLSITYRCPRKVVALAQRLVPDYQAAPDAPEGVVETVDDLDALLEAAKPGDFVLSRTNAPLARVALRLLRAGTPAKIQGRDIGAGLKATIRALAKGDAAHDIGAFLHALHAYEVAQRERLLAMKRDDRVDVLHDKCETLRWLADNAGDVANLTARIDSLFTDEPGASIICSTVHKAKGLEAERVWLLKSTFFLPVPCECGHRHVGKFCGRCGCEEHVTDVGKQREEENVMYVAITRTKSRLTFCMERL